LQASYLHDEWLFLLGIDDLMVLLMFLGENGERTEEQKGSRADHILVYSKPGIRKEKRVPGLGDRAFFCSRAAKSEARRPWILFQAENVAVHLFANVRIQLTDFPLSGGSDFNAIDQGSVPQFPHEVPEREGALFFRLFQSGPGVFQIDSVQFLLGQALQEMEVFYRDDGGQILPTAGDNSPFLSIGGSVYNFGKFLPRFRNIEACHGKYQSYKLYNC
jgi:hypothetical protein